MLITRLINNLSIIQKRYSQKPNLFSQLEKRDALANWPGGVKYPGFTYYPKPGEIDPPYEPSKLFMVQRIGPWKGTEYWYKYLLFIYKLDPEFKKGRVVIIKNTPTNCAKLWKIKHLVKITPITFPDGEPTKEDIHSARLNHKGELRIHKSLNVDPRESKEPEDPRQLTVADKKRQSLYQWSRAWNSLFDN